MGRFKLLSFLLGLVLFISCSKDETNYKQIIDDQIIAEINYVNYAWGPQVFNIYFTADRKIHIYNLIGQTDEISFKFTNDEGILRMTDAEENLNFSIAEDELMEEDDLDKILNAIGTISEDLSERESTCFDAGITTFSVYEYIEEDTYYKRTILKECGDWSSMNENTGAQKLVDILLKYVEKENLVCCF